MIALNRMLSYFAIFGGLLLTCSPALARTCGQQIFLHTARSFGPRTEASVRRDQLKLQAFENEVSRSLLQFGFSQTDLKKLLVNYEASVPVYCLVTPDLRTSKVVYVEKRLSKIRKIQLKAIMSIWRVKFGVEQDIAGKMICSDCSTADTWKLRFDFARNPRSSNGFTEFTKKAFSRDFAKDHHQLTDATIDIFIGYVGYYTI